MALGDFVDVRLKGETKPTRVTVKRAGGSIEVLGVEPAARGQTPPDFIIVTVLGQTLSKIEDVYFARGEVVSIVRGFLSVSDRKRAGAPK